MPKKIIFRSLFYKKLYFSLNKIPKRESLYYSEVFGEKYARAVGTAMKNNCLPILIPCHKIVGKNKKDLFTTSCFDLKPKCCKNIDVENCAKNIKERLREII
jgi:O-6-methylguanine DNA methyltransferase